LSGLMRLNASADEGRLEAFLGTLLEAL